MVDFVLHHGAQELPCCDRTALRSYSFSVQVLRLETSQQFHALSVHALHECLYRILAFSQISPATRIEARPPKRIFGEGITLRGCDMPRKIAGRKDSRRMPPLQ